MGVVGTTGQDQSTPRKMRRQLQKRLQVVQEVQTEQVPLGTDVEVGVLHVDVDHQKLITEDFTGVGETVSAGPAPDELGILIIHAEVQPGAAEAQVAPLALGQEQNDGAFLLQEVFTDLREVPGLHVFRDVFVSVQLEVRMVQLPGDSNQFATIRLRADCRKG